MSNLSIGEKIKKYRIMTSFTQAELATSLSEHEGKTISPSAIAGYESGQRVPKVETRVDIARILGVDPISLSGIELDEKDEKRLLCKLLTKYAEDITLAEDGAVTAELSKDFSSFQMEYEEITSSIEALKDQIPEGTAMHDYSKKMLEGELEYWNELYPGYDAAYHCKKRNPDYTIEDVRRFRELTTEEFETEFFRYQTVYLHPMLNHEFMGKIRKK